MAASEPAGPGAKSTPMKFFARIPRSLTSLSLALAAVPGPVPTSAVGGWTSQDPTSPQIKGVAEFAVNDLSEEFARHFVVEYISSAESQVVEGTNYRLSFRIAQLQDEELGARKDCTAVVWERPWLRPADQLTSFDCQSLDPSVDSSASATVPS